MHRRDLMDSIATVQNYLEEISHPMRGTINQLLDELYSEIESDDYYDKLANNKGKV